MYKVVFEVNDKSERQNLINRFSSLVDDSVTSFSVKEGVAEEIYNSLIENEIQSMANSMGTTVARLPERFKKVAKQMVKNGYYIEKVKVNKAEAKANKDKEINKAVAKVDIDTAKS